MVCERLDIIPGRQLVDDELLLEGAAQAKCCAPHRGQSEQHCSVEVDAALHGPYETRQNVEQRGLAGTIRSEQTADRRLELPLERIERPHATKLHRELLDPDHESQCFCSFA